MDESIGPRKQRGFDIGAEMVRSGMALVFTRYRVDYLDQETEAKAAGRGLHAHGCEARSEHRPRMREKGAR